MKIHRKNLLKELKKIGRVRIHKLSILNNVVFNAKDGILTIEYTDLADSVIISVPYDGKANFVALVPYVREYTESIFTAINISGYKHINRKSYPVLDVVNQLETEYIEIVINKKNRCLTIKECEGDDISFNFLLQKYEEYPDNSRIK